MYEMRWQNMLKRAIKPHIAKALDMYPVVILTGSRQVGKSTLAYEFVKEKGFAYVSLDNIDQRSLQFLILNISYSSFTHR